MVVAAPLLSVVTFSFAGALEVRSPGASVDTAQSMVEIRSYNLVPDSRDEFHRLVIEESLPLLRRWNVDVVAYGPSQHADTSYYLIRPFASLEQRQRSEDAFYESSEWRNGPREAILALIESYTTVVLPMDSAAVTALRHTLNR